MFTHRVLRRSGFVLIEALVALLLISVGLLAVSKLQVLSLSGAGEAKSYSTAMALSQQKLEELRNILLRTQFGIANGTANAGGGAGDNATYAMTWTVSPNPIVATTEQVQISLQTTWTDRFNQTKTLDLNSFIAWNDPGARITSTPPGGLPNLISPSGEAKRGSGATSPDFSTAFRNPDGSRTNVRSSDNVTELLSKTGQILLELPPKLGVAQAYTTITGKVFFDRGVNQGKIPASNNVRLRLSSEGECIFNNAPGALIAASGGNNYFTYTCYVGTGWYGNVGVVVDQPPLDPTVCVGDPNFNAGVSNGTLISAHPQEAATRSYRGFKDGAVSGTYLSTGVAAGRKYGLSYTLSGSTVVPVAGPFDGRPLPSAYTFPGYFATVTADPTLNYFEQNFLVTYLGGGGGASCNARMTGGLFARNAGEYFCINPHNDAATERCPAIWPNFASQVGTGGGSINFTLTVSVTGSGIVGSDITGINCGSSCSASYPTGTLVTLTATPATGATFTGWSGCVSPSGNTCTVAMSAAATVAASFTAAPTYVLTASKSGAGLGSIDSGDGIACGATCSASYVNGYQVTLTATAASGSTFMGWTGCLTVSGNTCNVTVSAATTVTAAFDVTPTFTLTAARVGSGTITSDVGGINCGTTCSASYVPGTTVTLTATAASGFAFGNWSGCTNASGNVCTVVMGSSAGTATATFNALPSYALTAAKAGAGAGTIVSTSPDAAINCGSTCSASYVSATTVTLSATAVGGSTFGSWSGCGSVSGATCTVSMTAAKTVTATFALNASCTTTVKGKAHGTGDTVTASSGGTCATSNSNSNYSCSLVAPSGTSITLTDVSGSSTYTLSVVATCPTQGNQNNVNFP